MSIKSLTSIRSIIILCTVLGCFLAIYLDATDNTTITKTHNTNSPAPDIAPSMVKTEPVTQKTQHNRIQWVRIDGGTYTMGKKQSELDEKHTHQETIGNLDVMKHEVTVNEYQQCLDSNVCWITIEEDPKYCNRDKPEHSQHPMNCIDWYQANSYCAWVGGRLPTEAEWEYIATNQGKPNVYPWGNEKPDCERAVIVDPVNPERCGMYTSAVCSHPTGNSEAGICDLVGNVFEWIHDWYYPSYYYKTYIEYDGIPFVTNMLTGEDSPNRGMRGGGIGSDENYRVRNRVMHTPKFQYPGLGVRCVRSIGERPKTTYDIFQSARDVLQKNRKNTKKENPDISNIKVVSAKNVSKQDASGTTWNLSPNIIIPDTGIKILYTNLIKATTIEISVDNNDIYQLYFWHDTDTLGYLELKPKLQDGLAKHNAKLTPDIARGFNQLVIIPREGDGFYSLGHIIYQ